MRVYIDDDGLHLFFEFAQGNFAKSYALLQNQAEQLFKSLRSGGFFYFFKGLLQCLLRNHIIAGTLQQQMAGFTDALRRHTVCRCLYGSTAPYIKGERLRILTQLVALAEFSQ